MMSTHTERMVPRSWGRYPRAVPSQVLPIFWRDRVPDLALLEGPILPYGYGRSYGDSCLNDGGILLDTRPLKRFIAFDRQEGLLRCEAGLSLADILEVIVPQGWFLPVTPGTKFVSVGGAIANDVHGKNHHRAGTFGCHITQFELLRSNGERLLCSPHEHNELFCATIGGLGLTGVILWAELRLKPIQSPFIITENRRFSSLKEFMEIAAAAEERDEYTVAWVDCMAGGAQQGRGIFTEGNHQPATRRVLKPRARKLSLTMPIDLPSFVLNPLTIKAFNAFYYARADHAVRKVVSYDPFFYPLDAMHEWNRLYGKRGFFQYQCIVPYAYSYEAIKTMLELIRSAGQGSFLSVLKTFGAIPSPGMLSFPRPGVELALDFANRGRATLRLLDELDTIVRQSGGAVYPAKDARMSPRSFQAYFPRWREFARYIDPKFSSSFWRRVTAAAEVAVNV